MPFPNQAPVHLSPWRRHFGGRHPRQRWAVLRPSGHLALVGVRADLGGEVDPMPILGKSLKVSGIYVGSRRMFEDLNAAIDANGIKPVGSSEGVSFIEFAACSCFLDFRWQTQCALKS